MTRFIAVLISLFLGGAALATSASATPGHTPVTLCHATNSSHNPYVSITIDVDGGWHGHDKHTGPVFQAGMHSGSNWGDIIPPTPYKGSTFSLNWDAEGQAIYNNGCAVVVTEPTPTPTPTTSEPTTPTPTTSEPTTPPVTSSSVPETSTSVPETSSSHVPSTHTTTPTHGGTHHSTTHTHSSSVAPPVSTHRHHPPAKQPVANKTPLASTGSDTGLLLTIALILGSLGALAVTLGRRKVRAH